jgi:N-acetylglutamate synthase-like GNAT family acetyltransferase
MVPQINSTVRPFDSNTDTAGVTVLYDCLLEPSQAHEAADDLRHLAYEIHQVYVSLVGGEVAGAATLKREHTPDGWVASISQVVVDPIHPGHEVFKSLVRRCVEAAFFWGCLRITIVPDPKLVEARVYKRLNFDELNDQLYEHWLPLPVLE